VADRRSAGTVVPAGDARERELAAVRPDLVGSYVDARAGARAAVLARLWGALAREDIDGIRHRRAERDDLVVVLDDGRDLRGPATLAEPFAAATPEAAVTLSRPGRRVRHAESRPHAYHDPGALLAALGLPGATARLRAELDDSVAGLALARAAQPAPDGGPPALTRGLTPSQAEQLVVDGHPLHPCCRTRTGLSTADIVRYAPEHRPVVHLAVVEVPAGRWLTTGAGLPPRLLVHPWQRDHVLVRYPGLRPMARTVAAHPLVSLRTLAVPGWHVKTAVDVQMTSAVRTVSAAAVHNGPALSALLRRIGALDVQDEVAAGAVLIDGQPCRSLAMVRRRAPRYGAGETVLPLAALAAPSPADGRPLIVEATTLGYAHRPAGFFADLVHLLFPPLTTLLHLGVALEAHGQNMCVVLRGGRPVRLVYRDFGGVRVSARRLAAAGYEAPPLHGDLASDDPAVLRTKLAAALLGGVVAETVAVLAREYGLAPDVLWHTAARALHGAYDALPATARGDRDALCEAPLPVKATTAMRLADAPLDDRWATGPNPMAGAG
jgi:siderophore synthetase component